MSLEIQCPGCVRPLRVGDDDAGRQAKCPFCNTMFTIPDGDGESSVATDEATGEADKPAAKWEVKTPHGKTYGPVGDDVLRQWVAQGRVTAQCELRRLDQRQWYQALQMFPQLKADDPQVKRSADSGNPFAAPSIATDGVRRRVQPHRGGLILAFGILGLVTCLLFGLAAWVMGSSDLKAMRLGRMDSTGYGLTQAGMVIGMISCLLPLIGLLMGLFFFVFVGIAGATFG